MRGDTQLLQGVQVRALLGFAKAVLALDLNVVEAALEIEAHQLGTLRLGCSVRDEPESDAPLPQRIFSWLRNRGVNRAAADFASFDVTITDATGRVLLEIEDYTIKRLAEPPDFTLRAPPSRGEVEFEAAVGTGNEKDLSPAERQLRRNFERGIRAEEGAEALMRVLARPELSQIVVSALDLAGRGLRDTTRLASSPPDIWRDVLATNRDNVVAALDALMAALAALRDDAQAGAEVERIFTSAARWRAGMDGA